MKHLSLLAGLVLAAVVGGTLAATGSSPNIAWTAGLTVLCALWWIFEPIPIPVTSLIPIALLPLVGVLTPIQVAEAYGSPLILLLLGGFMLSMGMEKSGAHRRLALAMVRAFGGTSGRRLVLGFMVATAVLSMWISNTATTLMMLPIVLAVMAGVEAPRLRIALLLGVAYAASIGGIGTPIGTPPNLIFMKVYKDATGVEVTFVQWMSWALPVVAVMLVVAGATLTRGLGREAPVQLPTVGTWRAEEVRTLVVFGVTALLWMTRKQPLGGWSGGLGLHTANDASVALLAVVAMFLVPNGKGGRLLDWETAVRIPWGILILFGSGIAIAKAFVSSGLSSELGTSLAGLGSLSLVLVVGAVCLAVTFLTEVTSNTASTTLLMPILAAAAVSSGVEHRLLMVPAAMSASFAFMLPVATGPNAVVFASGALTVKDMARAGLMLNLLGVVVVTALTLVTFG